MSRSRVGPHGGAVHAARKDEKMGAEHPIAVGPWKGAWVWMVKHQATKKRRARDRTVVEEQMDR